ncbi:MAG: hypothetical protein ABIG71_03155 [Candidatus Uhrbacteria bacterium]
MFLTLHAATGAFLGEFAPNGLVAFAFGFLSHFVLDMFPHGDRGIAEQTKQSGETRRYFWILSIDSFVAVAIFFPAFALNLFERPVLAYWGLLGGLLPDLIVAIPEYALYVKQEYRVHLEWFYRLHTHMHDNVIRRWDSMSLKVGIVMQIVLLIIIWRLVR